MRANLPRTCMAISVAAFSAGCGLLPDAYSRCNKPQPYQAATVVPPLRVLPGLDAPDTRNALRIPDVPAPQRPPESGRCLDQPPVYASSRPKSG